VAFLILVVVLIAEASSSDSPTVVESTETLTSRQTPVTKPVPFDALDTDMGVDRVVNARLGVVVSRDSGATCQRISRTRFACSVLRGVEDIATGWWVRCPPPVRSLDDWAAWCSLSETMAPEERCQFGVRSGDPFTAADVWEEEAVICRNLGVPID
jgi:hypothetical protein